MAGVMPRMARGLVAALVLAAVASAGALAQRPAADTMPPRWTSLGRPTPQALARRRNPGVQLVRFAAFMLRMVVMVAKGHH